MPRQPTYKQIIEAMDKAIRERGMTGKQMEYYLDLIDDLRGKDANRVYRVPPVQVSGGVFRRGKVEHR